MFAARNYYRMTTTTTVTCVYGRTFAYSHPRGTAQ